MPDGANAYPAYKTSVTPSGNAGWRSRLSGLQNNRAATGEMPDGAHAYPAYKTIVMPSGNAGWRCAYPAYKTTVLPPGKCRMALTLIRPTKPP